MEQIKALIDVSENCRQYIKVSVSSLVLNIAYKLGRGSRSIKFFIFVLKFIVTRLCIFARGVW